MKEKLNNVRESYPEESLDIENREEDLKKRPPDDQTIIRKTLGRYETEAEQNAYQSNPRALIELIADKELIADSKSIVDLGAGSGDLIRELSSLYRNIEVLGIDLSTNFARKFNEKNQNQNALMRIGLIDSAEIADRMSSYLEGSVISVLTLDRVADPMQLIKNMSRFRGAKILATLLPVVPEDDNPSRKDSEQKIEYTRGENRIVNGISASEDGEALLDLLQNTWGVPVTCVETEYLVESSGDVQCYSLATFYTK